MAGLVTGLLLLAGCNNDNHLRPPPRPVEYVLPPTDDPKFNGPPTYPKNMLNQDYIKKDKERDDNGPNGTSPKGPPRMGSGGGGY
jgi:hypothetical protein